MEVTSSSDSSSHLDLALTMGLATLTAGASSPDDSSSVQMVVSSVSS